MDTIFLEGKLAVSAKLQIVYLSCEVAESRNSVWTLSESLGSNPDSTTYSCEASN